MWKGIVEGLDVVLGGYIRSLLILSAATLVKAQRAKGVRPGTVNRYMALVRAILRRACFDWGWIDRVPKVGMLRDQASRIRSLSRDEYARLLAELPDHLRDMAQFLVATGLRQSNVTRLQWKQISLERRHLWVGAEQHKNGQAHAVPLNELAMEVLVRRQGDHPTHVFTVRGKPDHAGEHEGLAQCSEAGGN